MVVDRPATGLRGSHRLGASQASRLLKTARALRGDLPSTAHAMARGEVGFAQAEVIVDSLKDLTPEIAAELRAEGEATLIGACASLDPVGLGRLGRRLEDLLDPDGVQARDEAKIRDHEARAFGKREFTMSPDPYGSAGTIRGRYDAEVRRSSPPSWTPYPGRCADPWPGRGQPVGRPRSGSPSPCNPSPTGAGTVCG